MTELEVKKEYKERLEGKFKKINPYTYGSKEWDLIQDKVEELNQKIDEIPFSEEKEIRIDGEDFLIEFEEFVNKLPKLEVKMTSREVVLKKFRELNWKINSTVGGVWKHIKFIFSIPALAFSSFIFSFVIVVLFSIPLNFIFKAGFSDEYSGLTESILAAIIFVVLKTVLILDVHDRYLEENWVLYLLKYLLSIGGWVLMFFLPFIRYSTYETIYQFNYIEWAFYLPFLWIGGIYHEFFRLGIIGYLIVTILPILISLPIILYREFWIDKIHKANLEMAKKQQDELDDDNYHFDETKELEVLGQDHSQKKD